jgi:hypothetical protein
VDSGVDFGFFTSHTKKNAVNLQVGAPTGPSAVIARSGEWSPSRLIHVKSCCVHS